MKVLKRESILFMFVHRNRYEKMNMNMMRQLLLQLAMESVWERYFIMLKENMLCTKEHTEFI